MVVCAHPDGHAECLALARYWCERDAGVMQVLVWLLSSAEDAIDSARLLHKLPHNATVRTSLPIISLSLSSCCCTSHPDYERHHDVAGG